MWTLWQRKIHHKERQKNFHLPLPESNITKCLGYGKTSFTESEQFPFRRPKQCARVKLDCLFVCCFHDGVISCVPPHFQTQTVATIFLNVRLSPNKSVSPFRFGVNMILLLFSLCFQARSEWPKKSRAEFHDSSLEIHTPVIHHQKGGQHEPSKTEIASSCAEGGQTRQEKELASDSGRVEQTRLVRWKVWTFLSTDGRCSSPKDIAICRQRQIENVRVQLGTSIPIRVEPHEDQPQLFSPSLSPRRCWTNWASETVRRNEADIYRCFLCRQQRLWRHAHSVITMSSSVRVIYWVYAGEKSSTEPLQCCFRSQVWYSSLWLSSGDRICEKAHLATFLQSFLKLFVMCGNGTDVTFSARKFFDKSQKAEVLLNSLMENGLGKMSFIFDTCMCVTVWPSFDTTRDLLTDLFISQGTYNPRWIVCPQIPPEMFDKRRCQSGNDRYHIVYCSESLHQILTLRLKQTTIVPARSHIDWYWWMLMWLAGNQSPHTVIQCDPCLWTVSGKAT